MNKKASIPPETLAFEKRYMKQDGTFSLSHLKVSRHQIRQIAETNKALNNRIKSLDIEVGRIKRFFGGKM